MHGVARYPMKLDPELLKGSTAILLLTLLQRGPMYGYQIVQEVKRRSDEALELKEGSLYPALHKLEEQGLVESYWQERPDGRQRRYYRLTPEGSAAAEERRAQWRTFETAMRRVLADGAI